MKGITPIIAIVLLLLMTVAAAGTAYLWFTSTQGRIQQQVSGRITSTGANIQFQIVGLQCTGTADASANDNISFYIRNQGDSITNTSWIITVIDSATDSTTYVGTFNVSEGDGTLVTGDISDLTTVQINGSLIESTKSYTIRLNAPGGGEQSATCTAS